MNRVNNPSKYIRGIVSEGQSYYIGFGVTDLTSLAKGLNLDNLINGIRTKLLVTGKSGALRENTKGKIVRKQPEVKTSIWKHIEYYSKRFDREISYDRQFHIWEKEILHKYEMELAVAKTPQGEIVLHFPRLTMKDDKSHYMMAGAAMNMSIALGSYYMLYDSKFDPIIPVTKLEQRRLLGPGQSLQEKLEKIEEVIAGDKQSERQEANSYRFALLKEQLPDDVTMGIGGFNEYLLFEFLKDDLVIFENIKNGNATYLFRRSKFNKNGELNKQNAASNPAFLKRIIHDSMEDWGRQIGKFFVP